MFIVLLCEPFYPEHLEISGRNGRDNFLLKGERTEDKAFVKLSMKIVGLGSQVGLQ